MFPLAPEVSWLGIYMNVRTAPTLQVDSQWQSHLFEANCQILMTAAPTTGAHEVLDLDPIDAMLSHVFFLLISVL
jgi:hypothetical protein